MSRFVLLAVFLLAYDAVVHVSAQQQVSNRVQFGQTVLRKVSFSISFDAIFSFPRAFSIHHALLIAQFQTGEPT